MKKSGIIIDKKGNVWLPKSLKFPGYLKPHLNCTEWQMWIFLTAKGPENFKRKYAEKNLSRTTIWRIKKKLKAKKFL